MAGPYRIWLIQTISACCAGEHCLFRRFHPLIIGCIGVIRSFWISIGLLFNEVGYPAGFMLTFAERKLVGSYCAFSAATRR